MWINSRRRVWSCDRVNTPPACTCLGLIWKHKSRPAWHGQRGFCECPNCRLESEISARVIQSYCWILQKCSPPFYLPIISFPVHQCLWYLECVSIYEGFLIYFFAGFISKACCYLAPLMGNTLTTHLPCSALFFLQSPVSWHDKGKESCLLFYVFFPLHLFAFIRHQDLLVLSFCTVTCNRNVQVRRLTAQVDCTLLERNSVCEFRRTICRLDQLHGWDWIPWRNTDIIYLWQIIPFPSRFCYKDSKC